MTLFERMVAAIEARGFKNILNFARKIGVPHSSIYEMKRVTPREERLKVLADALRIDLATWRYGTDAEFEQLLQGGSEMASSARTFTIDTFVEPDGHVVGPGVMTDPIVEQVFRAEAGHRAGKARPVPTVSLAGVAPHCQVFALAVEEVLLLTDQGKVVDALRPGELLIVDSEAKPADDDLVVALHDDGTDAKLARYRGGRYPLFLGLDGEPIGLARDWVCAGVIVERRVLRS